MKEKITLNVNGQRHVAEVDPETPLLFVLNDELGLRGPRFGCGMAQCGACTVLVRGASAWSGRCSKTGAMPRARTDEAAWTARRHIRTIRLSRACKSPPCRGEIRDGEPGWIRTANTVSVARRPTFGIPAARLAI